MSSCATKARTPNVARCCLMLDTATLWAETWLKKRRNPNPPQIRASSSLDVLEVRKAASSSNAGLNRTEFKTKLPVPRNAVRSFSAIFFSCELSAGSMRADGGVAGGSARREYERRLAKLETERKARCGQRVGGWIHRFKDEPQSIRAWGLGGKGEELLSAALMNVPGSESWTIGGFLARGATSTTSPSRPRTSSSSTRSTTRA